MIELRSGSSGPDVVELQDRLKALGFDAGASDGQFGAHTASAVAAFQTSRNLLPANGVVDADTAAALGLTELPPMASPIPAVTVEIVSRMFPVTPVRNIAANLPHVLTALIAPKMADKSMVLMALATIRAETESFLPISEGQSQFNTSPGGRPFDLYDSRNDLGNQGPPDGEQFRGRGFVQLTGRHNYLVHGQAIGMGTQLIDNPDLANVPDIAAKLLASFLGSRESLIRAALAANDMKRARQLVNGGSNGLDRFESAFQIGAALIPEMLAAAAA
jgi:putative chitinase